MKAPGLDNNPRQVARINYCQRRAHTGGTQEDQTEPGKNSGGTDFLTGSFSAWHGHHDLSEFKLRN